MPSNSKAQEDHRPTDARPTFRSSSRPASGCDANDKIRYAHHNTGRRISKTARALGPAITLFATKWGG